SRGQARPPCQRRRPMTPVFTVNLLRVLFIAFCASIGANVGSSSFIGSGWVGLVGGLIIGLAVVLADRLLKGLSLRAFSSATFGLLLGMLFASLLSASDVLHYLSEPTQWLIRLLVYSTFSYLGMMLAMR